MHNCLISSITLHINSCNFVQEVNTNLDLDFLDFLDFLLGKILFNINAHVHLSVFEIISGSISSIIL